MTTTYKSGDLIRSCVLASGAHPVVLATKGDHVLCVLAGNADPFVTWWVDARGQVLSGAYHRELGDAIRSLTDRAAGGAVRAAPYVHRDDLESLRGEDLLLQLDLFRRRHGYTINTTDARTAFLSVDMLLETELFPSETADSAHINWLAAWHQAYLTARAKGWL